MLEATFPQIPRLTDRDMTVCLDGAWKVCKWPFDFDEAGLTASNVDDTSWPTVTQPGKVFYADPEAEQEAIPD